MKIDSKPLVMGVINLSAHSFYHAFTNPDTALKKALALIEEGADIIDVGAISTNPAADLSQLPSIQSECDTVISFIEKLRTVSDIAISVDTHRAKVMHEAVRAGANMINDQRALTEENALETAVKCAVPVCLMHHFSPKRNPGDSTCEDLLFQVCDDLKKYRERCVQAGILSENIILDPGFGGGHFGKNTQENFYLLKNLEKIVEIGAPVLVGLSRKSFLGIAVNQAVENRMIASVAAAVIAAMKGVHIIRVHDVKETVDAMKIIYKAR